MNGCHSVRAPVFLRLAGRSESVDVREIVWKGVTTGQVNERHAISVRPFTCPTAGFFRFALPPSVSLDFDVTSSPTHLLCSRAPATRPAGTT